MPNNFFTSLHFVRVLSSASERSAYLNTHKAQTAIKSNFKDPPKRMENVKLGTYHFGVGHMKNNFIFSITDQVMSRLIDTGIPQYFLNYIETVELRPVAPEESEPKVFEVEDLGFGFYVWLVFCALSILVFVGELMVFYFWQLIGLVALIKILCKNTNVALGCALDLSL